MLQCACSGPTSQPTVVNVSCQLPASCDFDDLRLQFSHQPSPLKPFQVILTELQPEKTVVQSVKAYFAMQGMAMGLNQYRLIKKDKDWVAEVMLPVCMQGRADWTMQLSIEKNSAMHQYSIQFASAQ